MAVSGIFLGKERRVGESENNGIVHSYSVLRQKCQYCDFLSFAADEATQAAYVEALLREIAYYGPHCSDYLVSTVYIGGGTPS